MSGDGKRRRQDEEARLAEALARLRRRVHRSLIPLTDAELRTLAKRSLECLYGSVRKREKLERYMAHLAASYGRDVVQGVAGELESIKNAIAWEEK